MEAPPIPTVKIIETITWFLVAEKSVFASINVLIPILAIIPNNNNIIPPKTAAGIVFSTALIFPINENNPSNLNERSARWKKENQRIKNDNARNKDILRQALFSVLDPFEELIIQVNLNGPLIDQRHKKRFFSSSLIMEK